MINLINHSYLINKLVGERACLKMCRLLILLLLSLTYLINKLVGERACLKMCRLLILLLLSLTYLTEARYGKKLQSVVIVGTVYCNTCSDINQEPSKSSHLIPGAFVVVECKDGNLKQTFRDEATTDTNGVFRVHLPSRHVKRVEGCLVELIKSSEPYCGVASTEASSSFRMESREQGSDVFSAGFFAFKPVKKPNFCNSKLFDPGMPGVPLLPELPPLPQLPPLPPLPPFPWLPPVGKMTTQSKADVQVEKAQPATTVKT